MNKANGINDYPLDKPDIVEMALTEMVWPELTNEQRQVMHSAWKNSNRATRKAVEKLLGIKDID